MLCRKRKNQPRNVHVKTIRPSLQAPSGCKKGAEQMTPAGLGEKKREKPFQITTLN